jgi:hypothetical protein
MKNKFIVAGIAALSIFSLASCKKTSSEDYNSQRYVDLTTIEDAVETDLKLFYTNDSTSLADVSELLGDASTEVTRYELYVGTTASSTLFTYNYDLTSMLEAYKSNNKTATVNALAMEMTSSATMYSSEKSAVIAQAYSKTTGVSSVLTDVSFVVELQSAWSTTISTTNAYKAFKDDNKTVSLSIVYMPIYVQHYYKSQIVLKEYVFLPVHISFTTSDGLELVDGEWVTSTISTISSVNLDTYLNSNGTVKYTTVEATTE